MREVQQNLEKWAVLMRRAIQLASLGEGDTSPNPLVGAIVLDVHGNIVGEGFHPRAGDSHAEILALAQAKDRSVGGSLVVTLEPCCHMGRTPPCTDAILRSGIRKVVIGLQDPDSRVSGKGIDILRQAGLEVVTGVLEKEVAFQNRAFLFRIITGRPWGILKCAISLDGRIGLPNGSSKWITCKESRSRVHKLRAKCDAIIVGGNTVRQDNPLLTTRGLVDPEPLRVVVTASANLPLDAKVWDTGIARTIVAYGPKAEMSFIKNLPNTIEKVCFSNNDPIALLQQLAKKGCNKVMWECGPSLATTALKKDCVQELVLFVAPKVLGGLPAMTPFSDFSFDSVDQAMTFKNISLAKSGKDFVLNMTL